MWSGVKKNDKKLASVDIIMMAVKEKNNKINIFESIL